MNKRVSVATLFNRILCLGLILCLGAAPARAGAEQDAQTPEVESASPSSFYSLKLSRIDLLQFSHDGQTLASGMEDGTVCLWDLKAGRPSRCLIRPAGLKRGRTTALAFSSQDQWIAAGQIDGSVDLFRTDGTPPETPCRIGPLPEGQMLGRPISSIVFTADGSLLAASGRNGSLRTCRQVFETAHGPGSAKFTLPAELRVLTGIPSSLFDQVAFDPAGRFLAVAMGTSVGVWTVSTGAQRWLKDALPSQVVSLSFSPDGKQLATGLLRGGIGLWDVDSGLERSLNRSHKQAIRAVAFSPGGTQLAARSADHSISLWDIRSGEHLRAFPNNFGSDAALAFNPDGSLLATTSEEAGIALYETSTDNEARSLRTNAYSSRAIAFNAQGTRLATASDDQQVRIWKRQVGASSEPEWSLACSTQSLRSGIIRSLAFSPLHGELVAVATESERVRLLNSDACTWDVSAEPEPLQDWVRSVTFSPNGRRLASGLHDGTVNIWDLDSGRQQALLGHEDEVRALAFRSPDGGLLATASFDKTVRLWEAVTGKLVYTFEDQMESVKSVHFSPNGRLLAIASAKEASLWDVETKKLLGTLPHEQAVNVVRFSPDGKLLGTASDDGKVRLWDVASHKQRGELDADADSSPDSAPWPVWALEFSPGGDLLAAATLGRISMWRLPEKTLQGRLWQGGQSWAFFTADGTLYRHDLGDLLWRKEPGGRITAVPPPRPDKPAQLTMELISDRLESNTWQPPEITVRIRNADAAGRAYWLHLEGSDLAEQHDLRTRVNLTLPPVFMKLDGSQHVDLRVVLSLRERFWFPPRPIRLCLTLRHAYDEQSPAPCRSALSQEISLSIGPLWWRLAPTMLAGAIILGCGILALSRLRRRHRGFSHPVIQGLLSGENTLSELLLKDFPEADAAIRRVEKFQSGILRQALDDAGISDHGWKRVLTVLDSPLACAAGFAESLLAKLAAPSVPRYQSPDVTAFKITFPPLSIYIPADAVLVVCTAKSRTPQVAIAECKPEELGWPRFAVLLDLSAESPPSEEVRKALKDSHPATVFVVVSEAVLRRILLSKSETQAQQRLRETIVSQCELRHIVPYREGNEISAGEECFFFGRQAELERMLHLHQNNFLLVGPRFMGKSSLLNALARELARSHPNVKVLKHQLFDGSLQSIQEVDGELRADSPEALYKSVMQRTAAHQIFLLDEADKFIELENKQQHRFCNVMRALHGQGRASFVLAGHQELHEATQTPEHPLRNFGQLLRLEPLDGNAAERMILEPITALGMCFTDKVSTVHWLREQTGCRPHLLALLCWEIVNLRKPLSAVTINLQEIQEEVQSYRNLRTEFGGWENGQVNPLDRAVARR